MAQGDKTGGRQKGTPNRRTAVLAELLDEHGCDPVAALVGIAQDADTPRELRAHFWRLAAAPLPTAQGHRS